MEQWTLKACRVNAGYTLQQVAKKVNKNFQTVSKYEKDSTYIPFELLKELSAIYQVKLDNIFLGDSTKKIELNKRELQ
ncbi:TPA: helix-turn-helix transcriptional regulator [Streptococcus pneumoniae]|nr:DNA-binding phage protein [Streptococcus pneumoniae]VLA48021.1 DNA-binding phage protein [Streptococcus pneumoniae]VMA73183.1 DNA-binding phage protein [Streptococcus pneumoniae]HET4580114.1 helix-turn-helix transcriptional regulator [Streptococcus pneumoniae]HET5099271.1 helix-turn-helix transcriptional regulator [Streptococcus pneumoniae]